MIQPDGTKSDCSAFSKTKQKQSSKFAHFNLKRPLGLLKLIEVILVSHN
jgi:hypothetical protein